MINKSTVIEDILNLYNEHKLLAIFKNSSIDNPTKIYISCWYYDNLKVLNDKEFCLRHSIIKAIWREFLYEENQYYTSDAILILNNFTDDLFKQGMEISICGNPKDYNVIFMLKADRITIPFSEIMKTAQRSFSLEVIRDIVKMNTKLKNDAAELIDNCLKFEENVIGNLSDEEKLLLEI